MIKSARHRIAPLYRALFRTLRPRSGGFRIMILHHIAEHEIPALDRVFDYVAKEYGFITPEEAETRLGESPTSRGGSAPYLVSFDDGFGSSLAVAETVLASRHIRALLFVCPGLLDAAVEDQARLVDHYVFPSGRDRGSGDAPALMTWEDVATLHAMGHTIGSHSLLHRRLSELTLEVMEQDVAESSKRLDEELGHQPRWFAFPFGDIASVSGEVLRTVSRHFRFCCSGLRGVNTSETHRCAILREALDLTAPDMYQRLTVDGGLDPLYRSRRIRLNRMVSEIQ